MHIAQPCTQCTVHTSPKDKKLGQNQVLSGDEGDRSNFDMVAVDMSHKYNIVKTTKVEKNSLTVFKRLVSYCFLHLAIHRNYFTFGSRDYEHNTALFLLPCLLFQ